MKNSHAHNLKPITFELGGMSVNIIFSEADLDEAADQASDVFGNSGQTCIAGF
jgi:acyl-CoA reductase-like NAD-dependent aldehyde dehydrogenase